MQQAFKQYAQWPLEECVIKFYEKLSTVWRFDIERFPCALGVRALMVWSFFRDDDNDIDDNDDDDDDNIVK